MIEYSYKYRLFFLFVVMMGLMTAVVKVASGNNINNAFHNKLTTTVILKAVKLVYFQDFPLRKKQNNPVVPGCFSALGALPVFGFFITPVLRCKENIYLLRPEATVESWEKLQKKKLVLLILIYLNLV